MSFGTLGDTAIPDRLIAEYAPTGRAACKECGANIVQDDVRIGEKVRSPWHDGFDIKWMHLRCGWRKGACVHDFKGIHATGVADPEGDKAFDKEDLPAPPATLQFMSRAPADT